MSALANTGTSKFPLLRDDRGSTAIIFGLLAVPLFGIIGVAVDYSRVLHVRTKVQNAVDAASIAVLKSGVTNSTDADALGRKYFTQNFSSTFVSHDPTVTFTVADDGSVRGTVTVPVPTTVTGLLNIQTLQVTAETLIQPTTEVEEEEIVTTVDPNKTPCLHVMSQSDNPSFTLSGNTNFDAGDCKAYLRSNRTTAMSESSSNNVDFNKIYIKGYASIGSAYDNATGLWIKSAPHTVAENSDNPNLTGSPYDSNIKTVTQNVTVANCTNSNTGQTKTGSVSPGTYCGNTTFDGATFAKGVYVIASGKGNDVGKLTLKGTLDGSAGVTFYFADNKSKLVSYTASSNSELKAPSDGYTKGLLFFEASNRGSNWDVTLSSISSNSWEGLIYLPSANLTFTGLTSWSKMNVSIEANKIAFQSLSNMALTPFAWTPYGSSSAVALQDESTSTTITTITEKPLYIAE